MADTFVEKDFGTGAVKITPSHDPNDYECGKRNNLPFINIFTDDGDVADNCGQFSGMKRWEEEEMVQIFFTCAYKYFYFQVRRSEGGAGGAD